MNRANFTVRDWENPTDEERTEYNRLYQDWHAEKENRYAKAVMWSFAAGFMSLAEAGNWFEEHHWGYISLSICYLLWVGSALRFAQHRGRHWIWCLVGPFVFFLRDRNVWNIPHPKPIAEFEGEVTQFSLF